MNSNTGGPFQGPNQHMAGIGLVLGLAGLTNNQQQQQQMMGAPQSGGMGGFVRLLGPRPSSPMIRGQRPMMGSPAFQASPPIMEPELGGSLGLRQQGQHLTQADAMSAQNQAAALSKRILSRLGPEINDEPEFQEKMFLPSTVSSLDESALRQALLLHLQPITAKTGVHPQLRGGRDTGERLHFYLGTNDERSFNEAKRMIIVLVQTVVAEMLELMAEEDEDDDEEEEEDIVEVAEDGTLNQNRNRGQLNNLSLNIKKEKSITSNEQHNASSANTQGDGTAPVENLSLDDLRRHLAQTINVQKIQYENKLQEVQLKALPEKDPEIEILPPEPPKGPLVVDLEDDEEEPTPEELELKKQMDQLKKAVDILGRVSKDPSTPSAAPPASAPLPAAAAPPPPIPVSTAGTPAVSLLDRLREKPDRNTTPEEGLTGRVPISSRLSRPSPTVTERPLIPQLMELPLVQQQRGARPIVHPMLGVRLPPGTSFGISPVNHLFRNDASGLLGDAPAGKQKVTQPPPDATSNNQSGPRSNNKNSKKKNNILPKNVNDGNNRSVDGNNANSRQNNNQNRNNGRGGKKQRNKRNKQKNNNNRNNNNANNNRNQSQMGMAGPDVNVHHGAGEDGASPPPPLMEAPLINPALDYLYNPTVVKNIQSRGLGEAGSPAMEKDPRLTGGLQIGYLPDMEFAEEPEQPYSEMLNSSVDQQGGGQGLVDGRQPPAPRTRSRSHRDKKGSRSGDRHHKSRRGLDEVQRGGRGRPSYPEKAQQERHRSSSSHDPTCPGGAVGVGGGPHAPHRRSERLSLGSTGSGEHPQPQNLIDQQRTEISQKMSENTEREQSLERRERSLERRERKERDARRVRYERYERERRYDQAKRERDKWVREEADRRERYEREKRYMHDLELEFYERYERERRERFEGERREWEERERAKLRKELEEELEAEQEAKNYGRSGPPVVYVSNVCPMSSEDKLHKHFSHYGQVTRVLLIRTRQKAVLHAEVYFDKWGHASRAVNAIPGAHVIDGYTLCVSHERFQLVCPITRMDELKVQKKPESFDEILRKYKMQAEIKKSRGVGAGRGQDTGCSSSYIPPPATSAATDGFSLSVRDRRGGIFRSQDDFDRSSSGGIEILGSRGTAEFTARIDLRAPASHEQEIVTLGMARHRPNRRDPRQPSPFPYQEASGLQKLKFSSAAGKPIGREGLSSVNDDKPRKLALVLDTDMPYYDANLVSQCRYPVVEGSDVSVLKCSELLENHWKKDGIQLVLSKGVCTDVFSNQQELVYVVMPSTTFLVKHLIGDFLTDAISSGLISGGYEETPAFKENLKGYIKSLSKHFQDMSYSSSKSDPFNSEVKLWLELLDKGNKDEEGFLFEMTEDIVTVRGVLALNEKINNVLKSLKEEGMLGLTEEGEPTSNKKNSGEEGGAEGDEDISVVFEGQQADGASSSSKKKKKIKKLKAKSPLVCLLEVLAQRMRIDVCSGSAPSAPVVVLDSDDEGTAGKQPSANSEDKENAPDSINSTSAAKNGAPNTSPTKSGSGDSIQAFMMRRLLHEAFAVHHCLKTAAAASKGGPDGWEKAQRALVYTAYALDWMGPAAVKKAVSHIKRQKVVQGKPELERLVASLLQGIRLFNALARATWCMAGCARPIVANLHDSVREEGEVDEEGEILDDDEEAGDEGRRRSGGDGSSRRRKHHHRHHHKDSNEESLERKKLHEEMKKVEVEKKKIEEERREIEEMRRSIEEQTKKKEQEDRKRLQEMEEMKRKLQEELAAMAAETEPSSAERRPSLVTSETGADAPHADESLNNAGETDRTRPSLHPSTNNDTGEVRDDGEEGEIVVDSGSRGSRRDRREWSAEASHGQPWQQYEEEQRHQQQYRQHQQQSQDSQKQNGERQHWQQRDQQYDGQGHQKSQPWQQQQHHQQQPQLQQYDTQRDQGRQEKQQQQNFQNQEQVYWQQYEKQQKRCAEKEQQQSQEKQVTNEDVDRDNCGAASTASLFNSNRLPTLALLRGALSRTQPGTTSEGGVKSTSAVKAGEGLEEAAAEGNDDGDQPKTFLSNRMPTLLMLTNRTIGAAPPPPKAQQPSLGGDIDLIARTPIDLKDIALPKCFNSTKYPIKVSSKKNKKKGKSIGTGGGTPCEGPTAVIEDDTTQDLAFPVPVLQNRGVLPSTTVAYSATNIGTHSGTTAPPYSNLSGSIPPPASLRTSQGSSGHPSLFVGPQFGPQSFDHPPPHFHPSNVGQHSYHMNRTGGLPMPPPQYAGGMPPMFGGPYSREMPLSMQMSFSSPAFAMDTEMDGVSLTEALDEELDVREPSGSAKLPSFCSSHPPGYNAPPPKLSPTPETSSMPFSLPPPPPKPILRDISLPSTTVFATSSATSICVTDTTTCVISGTTTTTVTSSVSPSHSKIGRPQRNSSRFAPPPSGEAANIHAPPPAIVDHETKDSRLSSISPTKRAPHLQTEPEKIVSPEKVSSETVSLHEGKSRRYSRSSTVRSSREGHRSHSRSPSVHDRRHRGSSSRHSKSRESKRRRNRSRRSEEIIIPSCSTISLGSPTYSNVSSSSPPRTEVSPSPGIPFDDIPTFPATAAEAPIPENAKPPVPDSTTTTTTASSVSGLSSQNDEGRAPVPPVSTAPIVSSTYFSLKRAMNKQKKLSKEEILALIEPRPSSSASNKETVASTVTSSTTGVSNDFKEMESTMDDVPSSTVDDETVHVAAPSNDGDVRTAESVASVDAIPEEEDANFVRPVAKATELVEDANDWFAALQSAWGRQEGGDSAAAMREAQIPATAGRRNKGGYLMVKPGEIPATQDDLDMQKLHQNKKKKKPRKKRNIENEIRKAAFAEGPTAPEDRIGPNAAQFLADEAEYLASIGGGVKRTRDDDSDDEAAGSPKKRNKNNNKKKKLVKKNGKATALVPLPYLRYVPDNHEFREFLYCYKHKEKEHQRKMQQLRRKKLQDNVEGLEKEGTDNQNDAAAATTPETVAPPVQVLRRMSPSMCSFAVRVWLAGTASFHVKWAEDLCHVFGLQFAPVRHPSTGGWLLLSNEAEDGASVLHLLKRYRLLDAVLHAALHFAAAALPKVAEDSVKVLKDRLALFAEKYDNTAARNLQQSIADGEQCSFFVPDWRNAYLSDLSALYTTVADAVRSLAKKQSGGWRQWSNGGVRVVAVVADSAAAVWCGGLVGAMAGRRGISLIGGTDQLLISDVEHADVVVGTPSQLLHVFCRNFSVSGAMDQEEGDGEGGISTKPPPRRHPLNPLAAVILDDVGHLAELPETKELLSLLKTKARIGAALHMVAIAHRVFFHELEEAERALDCSFPRTALQEPTLTDLELPEAAEEQLMFHSKDMEKYASKEPAKVSEEPSGEAAKELTDSAASAPLAGKRKQKAAEGKNKQAEQPVDKQQTQQNPNAASGEFNSEDKQRNESQEKNNRQREDVIDDARPARPLTFLEELELMRAEQKRLKDLLDSDEEKERRRERREMEKTMQHLREQQKKRLAEEHQQMLEEKRKMRKENEEKFNRILEENSAENEELEKRKKENEATARQAAMLSAAHRNPGGAAGLHRGEVPAFKRARSERMSVEEFIPTEIQQTRADIEVTSLAMEKDITAATTRKVIPIASREKAMTSVPKERSATNNVDRRKGGVISRQQSLDSIPPKNIPTVASVSSVPVDPRRRVQSTESQDPQGGRTRELSLAEHLALLREKSKGGRPLTKEEEIENKKRLVLERRQREEREREERILQIERKEKEKLDKDRQEKERLEKELKQKLKERQRLLLQQQERYNRKETQRQRQREREERLKEEEEELQMAQARAMVARAQQLKEASIAALKRAEESSVATAYTPGKPVTDVGPPSASAVLPEKLSGVVRSPSQAIGSPGKLTSLVGSPSVIAASPEKLTIVIRSPSVVAASPLKPATTTTTSSGGVPLTPAQLRKQQQRRLLEEEKRRLEERIQQELLKKQQRKVEQLKKKEASNAPAVAATAVILGEKEQLLQQEKRKRKMLLQESLQQEEMRKLKKVKQ